MKSLGILWRLMKHWRRLGSLERAIWTLDYELMTKAHHDVR